MVYLAHLSVLVIDAFLQVWFLSRETSQKYRPTSEDTQAFSPNEGSAGTDGISDKHAESRVRIKSSSSEAAVSHLLMM